MSRRTFWIADDRTHHGDTQVRRRQEALVRVQAAFPLTFDIDLPVPLAPSAGASVRALGVSDADADLLLRWWVSSPRYQLALAADGAVRYDLDGEVSGPVSERDRIGARRTSAVTAALSSGAASSDRAARQLVRQHEVPMSIPITARGVNASIPLDPAVLINSADSIRSATNRVDLKVTMADGRLITVNIASAALRRALQGVVEFGGDGCSVLLQGRLTSGNALADAALTVKPKGAAKQLAALAAVAA